MSAQLLPKPPLIPFSYQSLNPTRFESIQLHTPTSVHPRYTLAVIDRPLLPHQSVSSPAAVFLIPAGREKEFLFRSAGGLRSIAESADCARLIAVGFSRYHTYVSQEAVQKELEKVVQILTQRGVFLTGKGSNFAIPFLALDGLGKRNVIAESETETTGNFVVEETQSGEKTVRRLYFSTNENLIQSEVALKEDGCEIDRTHLAFDYHKSMAAGMVALSSLCSSKIVGKVEEDECKQEGLIIGLGGGGLTNFLHYFLSEVMRLTVVELDRGVLEISKKYFGVMEDASMKVVIGDGLTVCCSSPEHEQVVEGGDEASEVAADESTKGAPSADTDEEASSAADGLGQFQNVKTQISFPPQSLSMIGLDVDSKDSTVGMSCPPVAFVSTAYLSTLKSILRDDGILAMNVSARDPNMLQMVKRNVGSVFDTVVVSQSDEEEEEEELNVLVFAKKKKDELPFDRDRKLYLVDQLRKLVSSGHGEGVGEGEVIQELEERIFGLTLVLREGVSTAGVGNKTIKGNGGSRGKKKGGGSKGKKKGKRK